MGGGSIMVVSHHLDKALSHSDGERLDEDMNVRIKVLDADRSHEASFLLFLAISMPA